MAVSGAMCDNTLKDTAGKRRDVNKKRGERHRKNEGRYTERNRLTETNLNKTWQQNEAIMAVTSAGEGKDGIIKEQMGK